MKLINHPNQNPQNPPHPVGNGRAAGNGRKIACAWQVDRAVSISIGHDLVSRSPESNIVLRLDFGAELHDAPRLTIV